MAKGDAAEQNKQKAEEIKEAENTQQEITSDGLTKAQAEAQIKRISEIKGRITDSTDKEAGSKNLSSANKAVLKQTYRQNIEQFREQFNSLTTLEDFPDIPVNESNDDILKMAEWIKKNADALELLNNEDYRKALNDKEVDKAALSTKRIREFINSWFGLYEKDIQGPLNRINKAEKEQEDLKEIDDKTELSLEEKEQKKKDLIEDNKKKRAEEAAAYEKRKAPFREALNNLKEYNKLGQFADKLSEAGNSHDKADYKKLIQMLKLASNGHPFEHLYSNNTGDLEKMSNAEKKALPYYRIKDQINKYLEHKAKDGVNTKDLKKLAAVEELNQYVSEQIKELNPNPIKFGRKTYKQSSIHNTYQDEYDAVGINVLCNTATDETIYDTKAKAYNSAHNGKSYIDPKTLKNASSCLDRVMLRVQRNNLGKISQNLDQKDRENFINKNILKNFTKLKTKLVDAPITTKKAPEQVKEEPNLGTLIQ